MRYRILEHKNSQKTWFTVQYSWFLMWFDHKELMLSGWHEHVYKTIEFESKAEAELKIQELKQIQLDRKTEMRKNKTQRKVIGKY